MNDLPNPVMTQLPNMENIEEMRMYLNSLMPFEVADLMENKSVEDQLQIFGLLSPEHAAQAFDFLPVRIQTAILHSLPCDKVAKMLTTMPPDDLTALLEDLPKTTLDEYLKLLPPPERESALMLLGYPENSVGRLMTTDYLTVKMNWTVDQVLDHIRRYGHDSETISVIYVVDDNNKLIDDVKLKEFLFVPRDFRVDQISDKKFIALSIDESAEKAVEVFKRNDRVALPVIDLKGILKGIVTIDDVFRYAADLSTESMQHVGGTEALDAPYMETSFWDLIDKRSRWLVLLFLGEMFTATAMSFFEDEISKAVVLALFLPLIISSGGNSGSQSTTLIIRAMALQEVKLRDWWRVMRREIGLGFCLGCILGVVGFLRISLWSAFSDIYGVHWMLVALTIFLALIGVVLWGTIAGAMLPFLLRRVGWNPATASAPLVATVVDVTGIVIYFCIAMWILKGTLL